MTHPQGEPRAWGQCADCGGWHLMGTNELFHYENTPPDQLYCRSCIERARSSLTPGRSFNLARGLGRLGWVFLAVFIVVVIVIYLNVHSQRYSHCLVKPSLFAWPSACI